MVKKKKKKAPAESETPSTNGESSASTDQNGNPKTSSNQQNVHPKFLEAQAKFSSVIKQSLENNEYLSSSEEEDVDTEVMDNIMGKILYIDMFDWVSEYRRQTMCHMPWQLNY